MAPKLEIVISDISVEIKDWLYAIGGIKIRNIFIKYLENLGKISKSARNVALNDI